MVLPEAKLRASGVMARDTRFELSLALRAGWGATGEAITPDCPLLAAQVENELLAELLLAVKVRLAELALDVGASKGAVLICLSTAKEFCRA